MERLNVLFGFKAEKAADSIMRSLSMMGYSVNAVTRETKEEIFDYVSSHPELDVAVLKEYLDGGGELGTEELMDLGDSTKVNIVVVLDARKRGQDSMKDLYAAGILNAYFSDGKTGANADKLANLAVRGRTHKEAREYYHIDRKRPDHKFLSYYEFKDLYRYLINEGRGLNIADRFVALTRWIDESQLAYFIKYLPKNTIDTLCNYKEFVDINNSLYRKRLLDYRYKATDNAGITPENVGHKMVEEYIGRNMSLTPEPVAVNSSDVVKEEVAEAVMPEEDYVSEDGNDIYAYAAKVRENLKPVNGEANEPVPQTEETPDSLDMEGEPQEEEVLPTEPVKEDKPVKNLFVALKGKLFNREHKRELTATLEDIPEAEENTEFKVNEPSEGEGLYEEQSSKQAPSQDEVKYEQASISEIHPIDKAPVPEVKEAVSEEQATELEPVKQEVKEPVKEEGANPVKPELQRDVVTENIELRARLKLMEESVRDAKKDKERMSELLEKSIVSGANRRQTPVMPQKSQPVVKPAVRPVNPPQMPLNMATKPVANNAPKSPAPKAVEKVPVNKKPVVNDRNQDVKPLVKQDAKPPVKQAVKKEHKPEQKPVERKEIKGQTNIDDLISKWA